MQMQDVINMENYKQITNELPQDVRDYLEWSNKPEFRKKKKERLERRVIDDYNHKFENIAKNMDSEIKPEEFCSTTIINHVLDKCRYMAKKVCQFGRTPLELYMFLTTKLEDYRNDDNVIRDVYIAKKQDVTSVTCDVSGIGEYQSEFDIKKNLKSKIMGWVHSHGHNSLFHSSRDNYNIEEFVHSYGIKKNVELFNDGNRRFDMDFYYSPSLVINANSKNHYLEVVVKYPQFTGKGIEYKTYINQKCKLNIIDSNEKSKFDKELVDALILNNVLYNKKKLVDIHSYGNQKIKQELLYPISGIPDIAVKKASSMKQRIKDLIKNGRLKKRSKDRTNT